MVLFHNKTREDYSAAGIRNRLDLRVGTLRPISKIHIDMYLCCPLVRARGHRSALAAYSLRGHRHVSLSSR